MIDGARRAMLRAGAGAIASGWLGSAHAEAASVFGAYSQQALDRAYDQAPWAPNGLEVQRRYISISADVAQRMPPRSERYGPGEHQVIDVFAPPGAERAPVFVIIHGGAWRLAMREAYYGPAPAIVAAGCVCAVVGFDCIPAVSVNGMAAQVRQALDWLSRHVARFGGDGTRLHVVGHSSGAHVAAVMYTSVPGLRGAVLLSGLYELYPVMLSSRASYVHLTPDEVAALSPLRHLDRVSCDAIMAWGSEESPEFQRQSSVFSAALQGMGRLRHVQTLDGRNHYETFEQLYDATTPLMQAVLASARS